MQSYTKKNENMKVTDQKDTVFKFFKFILIEFPTWFLTLHKLHMYIVFPLLYAL